MKLENRLVKLINEEIEAGYISVQSHPSLPLRVFNYTPATQFEWRWNEATSICRGLILDNDNNIVARPFEKFFTLEQCKDMNIEIPYDESYSIFPKMDGSLGIFWSYGEECGIATRGSFTSEQAIEGTKILHEMFSEGEIEALTELSKDVTFLFEIIYPENRIVVDYGDKRNLVFLTAIDILNGFDDGDSYFMFFKERVDRVQFNSSFEDLKNLNISNEEGFVILFDNGFRMKIKFEEYLRLHKLYCGLSNKKIWEMLSGGKNDIEILKDMPDEFYDWAEKVIKDFNYKFITIRCEALNIFQNYLSHFSYDRKLFAEMVFKTENRKYYSIFFKMLDKSNYDYIIWKLIKPNETERFNSL